MLVVLVVLVVGVLAIARLFPAGFLSLRGAENNSYAGRLAQGALDVLKQNNTALADGIYMYLPDGTFDPNFSPALPDNSSNIKGTPPYLMPYPGNAAFNDINKARYISNETVTVPAAVELKPVTTPPTYASLCVPNFGPFDPTVALTVNGTLWTAKTGDSRLNASDPSGTATLDNPVDIVQPGQQNYLVDLSAGQIAVPAAAYPQTFVLTVTKKIAGTQTVTFTVPASTASVPYTGVWFNLMGTVNLPDVGTTTSPDPWVTAELYRPYQYLGNVTSIPANFYSADPYEYALYNPNTAPTAANGMQTLAFNPLAGGRQGVSPLQARLSYSTQDWHILHEDRDVPAGGGTLRLALSGLKKSGDVQFDQTLFGGLGSSGNDIYLLDRDDGTFYGLTGSGAGQNAMNIDDNSGPTSPGTIGVSYLNGRVTLPASFSGKHLRIFYAGVADWAVAVQKAPKSYTATTNKPDLTTVKSQTPNQYYLDVAANRVYFPRCDAGKMVELDNVTYTQGGVTQTAAIATSPVTDKLVGTNPVYVDLGPQGTNTTDGSATNITIGSVRGVSARALVIWHERDQWKTRSIDTLLTHLD